MKAFFLALAARLKNIRPKGGGQLHLTRGDALLLRWVVLCVVVLLATLLMLLTGAFEWVDTVQLKVLCGSPFYLEAEATQYSALSPGGPLRFIWLLCCCAIPPLLHVCRWLCWL